MNLVERALLVFGIFVLFCVWAFFPNAEAEVDVPQIGETHSIQILGADGRRYWLWVDFEGKLRIGEEPGFGKWADGTVVGKQ